jgi:hypothetical protein
VTLRLNDVAVSTHKSFRDREERRSRPTGLLFHIVAGAVLVAVMVIVALYFIEL